MSAEQMPNRRLPNYIEALCFVRSCFGIGEKESGIYPKKLQRARDGEKISEPELVQVRETLFRKIREQMQTPIGTPSFVADEIVCRLLQLYDELLPLLEVGTVSKQRALWILTEFVFLPTCFLILRQKWRLGLGTEFRDERCWYLPSSNDNRTQKPIQRVLDCWLRVAGFRTAYGVSKEMPESYRRKVDRWLDGDCLPPVADLHALVAKFGKSISWLDESNNWKARFTFACASQKAFDAVDDFFKETETGAALRLAAMFREFAQQPILHDDEGILVLPHTFFASRLIQQRLGKRRLDEILGATIREVRVSFDPEVSDSTIEKVRKGIEWEMKPGNWFAEYLRRKAKVEGFVGGLDKFIFKRGVDELNRMFAMERSRRA